MNKNDSDRTPLCLTRAQPLEGRRQFNPIQSLDFRRLTDSLDAFHAGRLKQAALIWDAIERRDDVIQGLASKRKKAVARLPWEILTTDHSEEALEHKRALEHFYTHVDVRHACDHNYHGGLSLLIKQMMDAVGKRYAVHEVVYLDTPQEDGSDGLSARFYFVPLWFFENMTGRLRFLDHTEKRDGIALNPEHWMITTGDGLMESSSVAYLYKSLPLKDWLIYCERNGMPGVRATTDATPGTPEWEAAKQAVAEFGAEYHALMTRGTDMEAIDISTRGDLPYPELVGRMDRVLAALWRGSDLGTLSHAQGQGASLQGNETYLIEETDANLISETLNAQVDRRVLSQLFPGSIAKAFISLKSRNPVSQNSDLALFRSLWEMGVPLATHDILERLGLTIPDASETLTKKREKSSETNQTSRELPGRAHLSNAKRSLRRALFSHQLSQIDSGVHGRGTPVALGEQLLILPKLGASANETHHKHINANHTITTSMNNKPIVSTSYNAQTRAELKRRQPSSLMTSNGQKEGQGFGLNSSTYAKVRRIKHAGSQEPTPQHDSAQHQKNLLGEQACERAGVDTRAIDSQSTPSLSAGNEVTDNDNILAIGNADAFLGDAEWVQIAPYGHWPHGDLIQSLSLASAQAMADRFHSLKKRLQRCFGGVPIYVGHPDDPDFSGKTGHSDLRAYGWVQGLKAGQSGLMARIKWSDAGEEILSNSYYKFVSPRWVLEPNKNGTHTPVELISIGLTNHPNLPGEMLSNSFSFSELWQKIRSLLDLEDGSGPEAILSKLEALCEECRSETLWDQKSQLESELNELKGVALDLGQKNAELEASFKKVEQSFKDERRARIDLILNDALVKGKLHSDSREEWAQQFESNFDQSLRLLESVSNMQAAHQPEARYSQGLPLRSGGLDSSEDHKALVESVRRCAREEGLSFEDAWMRTKRNSPALFLGALHSN